MDLTQTYFWIIKDPKLVYVLHIYLPLTSVEFYCEIIELYDT